ncbi:MAG: hypothetical protein DCC71_01895 [Proteobacteria bacterium]|nr:MAG: hypothetical protein DCC71_01895 [Pseudomonadota bacterium]
MRADEASVTRALALLAMAVCVAGCASTTVTQTRRAGALERPDRILLRNFAVTMSEVELDRGLGPTIARDAQGELASARALTIGRAASNALAEELVAKLRDAGLPAERSTGRVALTPTTAVIAGKFLTVDEGNQTMRTLVGFGAGASEVRTRVQVWMDGQLIAEAETDAKSGKKPGAAVTLGAGAAAGTAATAAGVAAGTTGVSEIFLTSVEADAKRTAREIADRILRAYLERGWLAT